MTEECPTPSGPESAQQDFRSLVEVAHDPIAVIAHDGRFLYVNQQACDRTDYSRVDFAHMTIVDFVPQDELDRVLMLREARHHEQTPTNRYETAILDRQGRRIPVEITIGPTTWEGVAADVLIVRDISERKRAEEDLLRRDEVFAAITFATDAFLRSDVWEERIEEALAKLGQALQLGRVSLGEVQTQPDGRMIIKPIFYWADASFGDQGRPEDPGYLPIFLDRIAPYVPGMKAGQLVHNDTGALPKEIKEILDPLELTSFMVAPILVGDEMWGCFSMGDRAPGRQWSTLETDVIQIAADIFGAFVRHQRTDTSLKKSEAMYRSLVEAPNLSIVTLDREGVLQFANTNASAHLGVPTSQLIGQTVWDLFPEEFATQHLKDVRKALDRQSLTINEVQTVIQGHPTWREIRIQPLPEPNGSCNLALVIASDITERKSIEQERLSYQEQLRSLTSDLLLTEQRERRRIAREIHDRIGQTLAISKMKLGALLGKTNPGQDRIALEEVRAMIDQTIQDTRTLTFDLSPPVLHELGLAPAVEWLVERLRDEHGLEATLEVRGEPLRLGDDCRVLLFQSIQELLSNTVKHAQARQVGISIRREEEDILVEIHDDGIGFDSAAVGRPAGKQVGYGLFSIRERLSHLGGQLEIHSQSGHGAHVLLRVPYRSSAGPCKDEES